MNEIENFIEDAGNNKFPFVIYRKPHSNEVVGIFQNDNQSIYSECLSKDGFVFAPFDDKKETYIIPYSNAQKKIFKIETSIHDSSELKLSFLEETKDYHIELVKKGIDFINSSEVDKVVLSRKEDVEIRDFKYLKSFKKLCQNYPNAFVYFWSHPKTGIWMGASPERLLTVKDNTFKVMALASTQEYKGEMDVNWGEKEIKEHQYVVDYVAEKIQDFDISISDTYTVKAGNLLHLRADLKGVISTDNKSLEPLIRVLHPTPAVCGLPKEAAKSFILDNEDYNREYYTGFLGELNNKEADLFVNLRCMKIDAQNNKASIYIGGGITKDSNPEKEWLETVAKSKVMKKAL